MVFDAANYNGAISIGAAYDPDTGALIAIEIYEAEQRIRVDISVMRSLLRPGSPWVTFTDERLRLTDGTRTAVYRLDAVDGDREAFYFSRAD